MATKEQERTALAKIRKIVAELGENSYVGTAFEGCFEDAEFNIDSDAAFSLKGRLELAQGDLIAVKKALEDEKAAHQETREQLADATHNLACAESELSAANDELASAKSEGDGWFKELHDAGKREEALEMEIIILKARLYDMMTAEA